MDAALPSTDLRSSTPSIVRTGARGYAVTASCLLLAAGVLLGVRRLTGGLATPLSPAALLFATIIAVSMTVSAREVVGRLDLASLGIASPVSAMCLLGAGVVGLLLFAVSLSIPGTNPAALVGMWGLVLAWVALSIVAEARRWKRGRVPRSMQRPVRPALPAMPLETSEDPDIEESSDEVFQQMQRGVTEDGHDFCHGWVRARFEPRQRVASIHLAFCPPMAIVPEMHIDQVAGPEAKIKIAQLLPYGARLELRLSEAHEGVTSTRVEFSAVAGPHEAPIAGS